MLKFGKKTLEVATQVFKNLNFVVGDIKICFLFQGISVSLNPALVGAAMEPLM